MSSSRDVSLQSNTIAQGLADLFFPRDKYFVFTPMCWRIGHMPIEIAMAVSIAKRDNKTLVLIRPQDRAIVNEEIFNLDLHCKVLRDGLWRVRIIERYMAVRYFLARIRKFMLINLARFAGLPHLRERAVHAYPRCGVERIPGDWRHRLMGAEHYFDLSLIDYDQPPVSLSQEQLHRGREQARAAGIDPDREVYILHIREAAFLGARHHYFRNATLMNFMPLIRRITSRGGLVIRLGDPSHSPVPRLPGFFDYAHFDHKSDLLELFLVAISRAYIGSSSGPLATAQMFGIPAFVASTGDFMYGGFRRSELYMPKHLYSPKHDRILSFEEALDLLPHPSFCEDFLYIENSAEEITNCFEEFEKYIKSGFDYQGDSELRKRYMQKRAMSLSRMAESLPPDSGDLDRIMSLRKAPAVVASWFLERYWSNGEHVQMLNEVWLEGRRGLKSAIG